MAISWAGLSDQWTGLWDDTAEILVVDPIGVGFGAAAGFLTLLIIIRLLRRKGTSPHRQDIDSKDLASLATTPNRPTRTQSPIDERFAALRLQTEELDSIAPPRRYFSGAAKPAREFQIRRR